MLCLSAFELYSRWVPLCRWLQSGRFAEIGDRQPAQQAFLCSLGERSEERESKTARKVALVSFLARSIQKVPFLGISLLRNQTETLATQARRPLIRSRRKCVLKKDPEWKAELSCVTQAEFGGDWRSWSEFRAVFLRGIRQAVSLESPTLLNLIQRGNRLQQNPKNGHRSAHIRQGRDVTHILSKAPSFLRKIHFSA